MSLGNFRTNNVLITLIVDTRSNYPRKAQNTLKKLNTSKYKETSLVAIFPFKTATVSDSFLSLFFKNSKLLTYTYIQYFLH
jgi:hypothetical protein